MIDTAFWQDRRVFVTGHTGFKGSWLSLRLHAAGAKVTGYALAPPTTPSAFDLCRIDGLVASVIADVLDADRLADAMKAADPEIVFHLAAQPLVRESYRNPAYTYAVNVQGTVNLFEAVRRCGGVKAVVNVTTDKCYENREWVWGYRENEPLGGHDPYSSSKACSELVTAAYRRSFFDPAADPARPVAVASARAGNVIGGGDWAEDRLVPDCIRGIMNGEKIRVRNPKAVRPWQHVLDPLSGYLLLAQKLAVEGPRFSGPWNFGPDADDARTVAWVVKRICDRWGESAAYQVDSAPQPHEASYLKLDSSKARAELGWEPRWDVETAIDKTIEWWAAHRAGKDMRRATLDQIADFAGAR